MKRKRKLRKLIALAMVVIIGTQSIPQQVYANNYDSNSEGIEPTPYIVAEDTSLREETVKHFRKSDGTMVAVDYGVPVHYQEDGEWKDYNNSLELINDENGSYYKANPVGAEVLLPEKLDVDEKVSISSGDYTLEVGMQIPESEEEAGFFRMPDQSSASMISNENNDIAESTEEKTILNQVSSGLKYNDVLPNTDIEYIVIPNQIKENIIIGERQDEYSYRYVLSAPGLSIYQNEDNSFTLYSASETTAEAVFTIAAPYMWDSNGKLSREISANYETTEQGYVITYIANADWLNDAERSFPITIDPTIIWSGNAQQQSLLNQNIKDTYVSSASGDQTFYGNAATMLGTYSNSVNRIYTQITLPDLPLGATVTGASYQLTSTSPIQHSGTAGLYAVGDDIWSYDQITWNNQPTQWLTSDMVASVSKIPNDNTVFKWNITSLVQKWYETGINNGFAIKMNDETVPNNLFQFYSCSGYGVPGNVLPAFVIEYSNAQPEGGFVNTGFVAQTVLMQLNHDIVYVCDDADIEDTLLIKSKDETICHPQISNGTTMIPVEFFADIFGANLVWYPTENQTIISINDNNFQIVSDDPQIAKMDVQGVATRITLQHAPAMINGCIYMAIRDLGYILDYSAIHYIPVTDENQVLKEYVVLSKNAGMTMEAANVLIGEKSQYLSKAGMEKPENPFITQTMFMELGHRKAMVLNNEALDRVYTMESQNDIYACPKNVSGTIVPAKFFVEAFGAEAEWDAALSKLTFSYQNQVYEVVANQSSMTQTDANGQTTTVALSRNPMIDNGFLYMGIHDVRTIFGCSTIYYFGNFDVEPAEEYVVVSKDAQMSQDDAWVLVQANVSVLHVKPQILGEDIEKRGEFEKHFFTDTGEYIAATYAEPVHYEENGEWVDIDNRLVTSENAAEEGVYENNDNPMQVQLAQSTQNENLISIQSGEHQISWNMSAVESENPLSFEEEEPSRINELMMKILVALGMASQPQPSPDEPPMNSGDTVVAANTVAAVLGGDEDLPPENVPKDGTDLPETNTSEEYGNSELLTLGNISSQVQYSGTFNNIDVKYALSSTRVKEDIVIKQASDISTFAFVIRCGALEAQINEDNTVSFIDGVNDNEEVFIINAPYMTDAEDEYSSRVRVDLQEIPDGYIMTYTPDLDWLNDTARVYPVTVDPDISTSRDKLNIYDTCVKEYVNKSPNYDYYTQPSNLVGTYGGNKYRTFLRFANMPNIPAGSKITSASLKLNLVSGTTTAQRLSFYEVKNSWTSTNVTWNFSGSALNIGYQAYVAYTPVKSGGIFRISPNITGAVQRWYNCNGNVVRNARGSSSNYGFMIRYANLNENGDYNRIVSGEHGTTSMRPSIAISYTGSSANPAKPGRTIADGTYFIRNMNSGKYLDVLGSSAVNKSSVGQYDFTGCTNQQWRITYESDGYYRISPVHASSKALDMQSESSSRQDGTSAWIYDYKPTLQEQKWLIKTATGGGYEFITKASSNTNTPKALEITNSSSANGAKAQIWTSSKSRTNDNWALEKSHTLSTPQIGQQYDQWCWVTCAEMAVRTDMKVTKTQMEAAKYVKQESTIDKLNTGGSAGDVIKAVMFFSNNSLVYTFKNRALSENELLKMLHSGSPVIIFRLTYDDNGNATFGHATIIYGYHFIGNQLTFEIRDPWPTNPYPWPKNNVGKSYTRTYREIVNGRSTGIDQKKWDISIYKKF